MRKATKAHAPATPWSEPTFNLRVRVARPPAVVFALLTDVQDAEPIPRRAAVRMEKDPPGPTRVGTRWHEKVRLVRGLWLHVESVVTVVEEPVRLGMDFRSAWFTGHLDYEVEPAGSGSVLHQRETLRMRRPLRRLAPAVERELGKHLVVRLEDIKALLEAA